MSLPHGSAPKAGHWAGYQERGSYQLMRFTAWAVRLLGRRALAPLLYGIVLYFFLFGRRARRSVWDYQRRLAAWSGRTELRPDLCSVFAQFTAFADALLDKLDVWRGQLGLAQLDIHDPTNLHGQMRSGRGQLLVGAHLGNLEVCRALGELGQVVKMNVLVHTKHAERFNRLLGDAGADSLRLIQVSELDPAIMLQLSQRLDAGEWLAMAGDRIPLHGGRTVEIDFLGSSALLPQGPWLLGGLLQCRVNLLFCLKHRGRYRIDLEPFADSIAWRRPQREAVIRACAQRYADRLAHYCLQAPPQWFNFYPFWNDHDDTPAV
ncbi:MAG: glycosyl transferase [Pseudomonadota bacterium]